MDCVKFLSCLPMFLRLIKHGECISNYKFKDLFILAKYYYWQEKKDDSFICDKFKKLLNINDNIPYDTLEFYEKKISNCIKWCKMQKLRVFNPFVITLDEIETIKNMSNNTILCKLAFTYLCMYKANNYKPIRVTRHMVANTINLNVNSDLLKKSNLYLVRNNYLYLYDKKIEHRRFLLQQMIDLDSQDDKLFIDYDVFMYERYKNSNTVKAKIALWKYNKDNEEYCAQEEEQGFSWYCGEGINEGKISNEEFEESYYSYDILPIEWYKHLNKDQIARIKQDRYKDYSIEEIRKNINENLSTMLLFMPEDEFKLLIGGYYFYKDIHSEVLNRIKYKVMFAHHETNGITVDVNNLDTEFNKLFVDNIIIGECIRCGENIIKKSNRQKYCIECKKIIKKEQVKNNMRKMRGNKK